jgi:tetratricopeptide (TPR) repeat protein/predicted Ser/Thr protein kinase
VIGGVSSRGGSCPDDERLQAWMDGRAGAEERRALDAHLDRCPACRRVVALAAPQAPPEAALPRGTTWSRYVVLDLLGAGGMGLVYTAWDPELDRRVALKVLQPGRADPALRARVQREAQAMARVAHPNVVAVHDVGVEDGEVFVVMELVQGAHLGAWLQARPREADEVLGVFLQAGRGLAAAHAAGVVHRDFKPENVLVGDDGRVVVTDFGLATANGAALDGARPVGRLTEAGAVIGTPAYMAPEQHDGAPVDARSDLFSFCVALWEGLTGQRPYVGRTVTELRAAIACRDLQDPGDKLPTRVRAALERGLSEAPERRQRSMDELLLALAPPPSRWRLPAAAALLVALSVGATAWVHGQPARACAGAGEGLVAVWSEPQRAEVARAFGDGAVAQEAARGVVARLDAWGGAWSEMRVDVCRGARVREDVPAPVFEARVRCLDRRLEELRALVRLLSVPDAELPTIGRRAAWALAPVSRCADVDALLAPIPLPEDPAQREPVEQALRALAEVDALRYAGRYRAGLEQAVALAERAGALGYAPLRAEALEVLGDFQERNGDFAAAAASLREAVLAAERGRDVRRAAHALAELTWVVGHQQSEREEGLQAAAHAEALLEGVGGDLEISALLASNRGAVLLDQGEPARAEQELRRALETRLALYGETHPQVAVALVNLAATLSRQNRPAEALPLIERAAAVYAATVGEHHPLSAQTLLNLADAERELGRFAEGRAHAELARQRVQTALGEEHPLVASAENVLGLVALGEDRFAEACDHLARALLLVERARGPDHPFAAHYGAALGEALYRVGDYDAALVHEQRALDVYTQLGDEAMRGGALYVLGRTKLALGRRAEARADLEAALALAVAVEPGTVHEHAARFALAQLLGDEAEARRALVGLQGVGPVAAREVAEAAAWLAGR